MQVIAAPPFERKSTSSTLVTWSPRKHGLLIKLSKNKTTIKPKVIDINWIEKVTTLPCFNDSSYEPLVVVIPEPQTRHR